ncbi:hypothetical protein L1887_42566 [Cichorium endivia]|nr:hypothetical protein L1887_42566 [Cichorium endivia]
MSPYTVDLVLKCRSIRTASYSMTRLEVSWICAQDVRSSRVHGSNAGDDPRQVRALLRQSRPFLSDLRTACCGSGAVSESELANRTKAKPRGQHRKFSRRCPRLADTRIGLAGQAIRCRRSFFFLSVQVVCTFTRQRPSARVEGSAKAAAAAAICTKLHEALENFAIRNRQTALRCEGWPSVRAGPTRADFKAALPFFFFFCVESLPSGALVHLAVFSPSAALAGLSWLINRSLPIFRLRLASSSPTLGAPRHRERARVQADDSLSAMRTPSLHPQLSAAKTSKPPHLELGKND